MEYTLLCGRSLGISAEGLSKWYIDGANIESESANAYILLHARIEYGCTLGGLTSDFAVYLRNLTDKTFIAFTEPDPGGNAYQAGARREAFASLRIHRELKRAGLYVNQAGLPQEILDQCSRHRSSAFLVHSSWC